MKTNYTPTEKLQGIVYAFTEENHYDMVRDLGVEWIRLGIPFPWSNKMHGTVAPGWLDIKEKCKEATDAGLKVMPSVPGMGGWGYNYEEKVTRWDDSWPDFVGAKGTDEYYKNIRDTAAFMCEDLGDLAGDLWQCMNEIDHDLFVGDYPIEVVVDTCRAIVEGIVSVNPDARCGHNFSGWNERSATIGDLLYRPGHSFAYCGIDQYFGSWTGGCIEDWVPVIDERYARWGLPLLINEWGYSSSGATISERPAVVPAGWGDVCVTKSWYHEVPGGHTPEVAAEYFRRGLEIFAKHPHVMGNFLFCFSDAYTCWHCGQENCPAECSWGLTDVECRPKPAYFAAQKAIREYYR